MDAPFGASVPAGTPVNLQPEQLALFQDATPLHAYMTQVLGVQLTLDRERGQLFLRGRPDDVNKAIHAVHQAAPTPAPAPAPAPAASRPAQPPHPLAVQSASALYMPPPVYQLPVYPAPVYHPPPHMNAYGGGEMHMGAGGFGESHMGEYVEEPRDNQVVFQMYEKDTARLIGRRGAHLHQLQDETGARIQVDSNVPPGTPRTVYVWGSVHAVDNALVKIYNKLRRTGEPFLPVPKPSFADRDFPPHRRDTHPLEVEHEWPVEIGASKKPLLSAEVVKEIEENSGANIVFFEEDSAILKILVKGLPLPIHYAVAALFDQVDGDLKEPTQIEEDSDYPHLEAWLKEPLPQSS